jgi:hypothetical protein
MYPAAIADDHGSRAERRIFAKLRDETPDSWTALHSVGLANHSAKPWAESTSSSSRRRGSSVSK